MNFLAKPDDLRLRVGYVILASLLILVGVLIAGTQINSSFGVRTEFTMRDPSAWRSVNLATGFVLSLWGWLALFVSIAFSVGLNRFLLFSLFSVVLVSLPALAPHIFIGVSEQFGLSVPSTGSGSIGVIASLILFAGVGNILFVNSSVIGRNSLIGFRLKKLMQNDEAWRKGNATGGLILHLISGLGLIVVLIGQSLGYKNESIGIAFAVLLIAPLAAGLGASSIK